MPGNGIRQVRGQLDVVHRPVDELRPFVHEDHVDLAVLLVERAVDAVPFAGLVIIARRDREGGKRPLGAVGAQQVGLVVGDVVAARDLLDEVGMVAPRAGIVVIIPDLVDLRRGDEARPFQPQALDVDHVIGTGPGLEVGTLVHLAAGAGQVIHLRGLVRQDVGVAHGELFEGDGADTVHLGHAGAHHGGHGSHAGRVGGGGQGAAEIALSGICRRRLLARQHLGEPGRAEQQRGSSQETGKGFHHQNTLIKHTNLIIILSQNHCPIE